MTGLMWIDVTRVTKHDAFVMCVTPLWLWFLLKYSIILYPKIPSAPLFTFSSNHWLEFHLYSFIFHSCASFIRDYQSIIDLRFMANWNQGFELKKLLYPKICPTSFIFYLTYDFIHLHVFMKHSFHLHIINPSSIAKIISKALWWWCFA